MCVDDKQLRSFHPFLSFFAEISNRHGSPTNFDVGNDVFDDAKSEKHPLHCTVLRSPRRKEVASGTRPARIRLGDSARPGRVMINKFRALTISKFQCYRAVSWKVMRDVACAKDVKFACVQYVCVRVCACVRALANNASDSTPPPSPSLVSLIRPRLLLAAFINNFAPEFR